MFDLREKDMVKWSAGDALGRCAPSRKVLARALDADPSTVSRRTNGSPGHGTGPEAAHFLDLKRLTEDTRTVPFPLLVGGVRAVLETIAQSYPTERVKREMWASLQAEQESEGRENCPQMRIQNEGAPALREWLDSATDELDAQLAAVVLGTELLRRFDAGDRDADPRTWEGGR